MALAGWPVATGHTRSRCSFRTELVDRRNSLVRSTRMETTRPSQVGHGEALACI
jgi:hypothetical protein